MNDLNRFLQSRKDVGIFVGFFLTIVTVLYAITHTHRGIGFALHVTHGTRCQGPFRQKCLLVFGRPVEQPLWNGEFQAGAAVEAVKIAHGPLSESTFGRYSVLGPAQRGCCYCSCVLYAKDGQLVSAVSFAGAKETVYFDTLTAEEWA